MEQNILAQSNMVFTPDETKTLEAYLAEILRIRGEIDAEQNEIERIKADNRELKVETRAILSTLKAAVLR